MNKKYGYPACVYRAILVRESTGPRLDMEFFNKNGLDEKMFINLVMLSYPGWEIGSLAIVV